VGAFRRYIAIFYLIFFASIKLSGLHAFTHSDDIPSQDCDVCECILATNKIPLLQSDVSYIKVVKAKVFLKKTFIHRSFTNFSRSTNYALFSRPPPTA
jgi:hypothetical protein